MKAQYDSIKPEIDAAIQRVITNSSFVLGPEVAEFERQFAAYVGAAGGAAGVASGTAALYLALVLLGVGPGREVITTAHTFIATAEAISQTGAKPVFVDIDPKTYTIDPRLVSEAITPATAAIIAVHLYGHPAPLEELETIARQRNLWLIEDAAQAHGAELYGRRCGAWGDLACFSFYPGKNLGAYGDGGAITSNSQAMIERLKRLRDHGRLTKYEHEEIGFGERLDALQAAILRVKLAHLEQWTVARRRHASLYRELLAGSEVVTPHEAAGARHVYHLFVIRTAKRDKLLEHLKSRGIQAGIHYPVPLHRQPACLKLGHGYDQVSLPETEKAAAEVLSLPMYPELSEEQIAYVAKAVREVAG